MSSVSVCSDSEAVLALRACSHLQHQRAVLRSVARALWISGVVVCLVWVPSNLQPGNPMLQVNSVYVGSQAKAEVQAVWERMLCHLDGCKICGVLFTARH